MALKIINEKSRCYLTVAFYDKDGNAAIPTSATYRIDCVTNNTQVKDDSSLTPGSSIEIPITSSDNAIIAITNTLERRKVTVEAVYGSGDEVHDEYEYYVKNLSRYPSP